MPRLIGNFGIGTPARPHRPVLGPPARIFSNILLPPRQERPLPRLRSTLATIWRLAHPYFYSEDRWTGRILLAAVIAIELATIGINVLINQWNNAFYDAIQNRDWDIFIWQLEYFTMLATGWVIFKVYQTYLNQWLVIRWRQWMTTQYLE